MAGHITESTVGTEYFPILPGNPRPRREPGDTGNPADDSYFIVLFKGLFLFQLRKHGGGAAVKAAVTGVGSHSIPRLRMLPQIIQNRAAVVNVNDFLSGCRLPVLCQVLQNSLCAENDLGGGNCFLRLLRSCLLCADTDADQGEDSASLLPRAGILQSFFNRALQPCTRGRILLCLLSGISRSSLRRLTRCLKNLFR